MVDDLPSVVEFTQDIGDAEPPPPLPPGEYPATIKAVEVRRSQRDTQYCAVTFFIDSQHYPVDFKEGDPDGETIIYRRVPLEDNQKARFQLRRFIESIGGTPSKRIDVNEWIGLEAMVTVSNEEYDGLDRANIQKVSKL